jgi:hypothetical protein
MPGLLVATGGAENGRVAAFFFGCGWPTSRNSGCAGNLWVIHAAGSAAETPAEKASWCGACCHGRNPSSENSPRNQRSRAGGGWRWRRVTMTKTWDYSRMDFVCEVSTNRKAVYLNFLFWANSTSKSEPLSLGTRLTLGASPRRHPFSSQNT